MIKPAQNWWDEDETVGPAPTAKLDPFHMIKPEARERVATLQTERAPPKAEPVANAGNWWDKDEDVLSRDQEDAANQWAEYLGIARKHHGNRRLDVTGGETIAADDVGLWKQAQAAAKRSGWKAPPKGSVGDAIATGGSDFAFSFGDELASGVKAAGSFVSNMGGGIDKAAKAAGDTWDLSMDQQNMQQELARRDEGGVALGTTLGLSLIPGLGLASRAKAGAVAAPVVTNGSKFWNGVKNAGKVVGAGAAMGELSGIGNSRGDIFNRVKEAGVEAPIYGAVGGAIGGLIGKGIGSAIKGVDDAVRPVFMSPENRATYLIERAMKRDGVTLDDLMTAQRRVKNMGGDTFETLAELAAYSGKSTGKNLRGLARALHAQPGRASELAEQLIAKRRASIHSGASKAVASGTGQKVANYNDQISDLETQLTTSSKKAYDDFRASPVDPDVFDARVAPILMTEPGRRAMTSAAAGMRYDAGAARAAGDAALAKELDDAAALLELNAQPGANRIQPMTPRALDEVKRAFDDQIEEVGHRSYTGGKLRTAKNNFADGVSSATGGAYGNALGTFSGGKRLREAIDAGYGIFNKKAWQLDELMEGTGGPGGILSQGEVEGIAFGFGRALQDAIDSNDLSAVRKIMRDKAMQEKLATIMGGNYPRFMSRILRMLNRQDFDNFVAGGSPTARIQAELGDAGNDDAMTRVLNSLGAQAAQGGTPSIRGAIAAATVQPMARGAANLWRKFAYRGIGNEQVNEELGKQMFTPMRPKAMRDFSNMFQARPASRLTSAPAKGERVGSFMGATGSGRDAAALNSTEERAAILVEQNDTAMLEEYLDPSTPPARLRQIEKHFGPQAAELWRLRASVSAPQSSMARSQTQQ
jgi:hypothetical protein